MAVSKKNSDQPEIRRRPPPLSPDEYEKRLISLAMGQIEEQLLKKTASAQVLTQLMRMASSRAELEKEKLRKEIVQLEAKTKAMESEARMEEMYSRALDAMRSYGSSINNAEEDDEDI